MKGKKGLMLGLMAAAMLLGSNFVGEKVYANATPPQQNQQQLIGEAAAIKTVLAQNPDWQVKKIELDRERGRLVYEIEILNKNQEKEYKIDAETGAILNYENEREFLEFDSTPSITLQKAVEIAVGDKKDVVLREAELEHDFGKLCYEVRFTDGTQKYSVKVNAKTGEIISSRVHSDKW